MITYRNKYLDEYGGVHRELLNCCIVDCANGETRLVDGETEWEGRLEICFGQRWGTVSSDGWTEINSQVVCNSFGFDFTPGMLTNLYVCLLWKNSHFPQISWLTNLYFKPTRSQSIFKVLFVLEES